MLAPLFAAAALMVAADPRVAFGVANPAVTDATARSTVCVDGWTKTVRPPASWTDKLKRAELPAGAAMADFELDHVLPIEDGGAPRDAANLRLQRWTGPDGARAKDVLETSVHRRLCAGTLTLAQGRAELAAWIRAHRPYEPLPKELSR